MTINSLYLDDQAGNTLTLIPNNLITITAINIGLPEIRAVVEDRPDTDGTRDTTALIGARAVSINAELYSTPAALADQWRAFMAPRKRCYLYCYDTEWVGVRRMLLRADQWTDPIVQGADDLFRAVQAQWKGVDGLWEDATSTQFTINAYTAGTSGMTFTGGMKFPIAWTAGTAVTGTTITNNGALPLHFTASLYGSAVQPILINDTTGQSLSFSLTYSVAAGVYIAMDTRERTAWLNSDSTLSQLPSMDLVNSVWWQLQPGANTVRYAPGGAIGATAQALITFRQTYL